MALSAPKSKKVTVHDFKRRLRKTALATPAALVKKAVGSIKTRIAAVYAAKGGHIKIG